MAPYSAVPAKILHRLPDEVSTKQGAWVEPPATALRVLRPRGVLTVNGVATKAPFYQSADLVFKELTIRGSFIYQQEFDMAVDLLARGVIDIEPLTSAVRDIDSGPETFAQMRTAAELVKVVLSPIPATEPEAPVHQS